MTAELQVRAGVIGGLAERAVQQALRSVCLGSVDGFYLDHADVVAHGASVTAVGGVGELRVPVDVYVVRRDEVLAGGLPTGATAPAGRVTIVFEIAPGSPASTQFGMRAVDVDLGTLAGAAGPAAGLIRTALTEGLGAPVAFDLRPLAAALKLHEPSATSVEAVGGALAFRLDPTAPPVDRVAEAYEWTMFVDAATLAESLERMARDKVQDVSMVTSFDVQAHWRPAGSTPHVDLDYRGKADAPDPLAGDFDGTIYVDFSVSPTPAQRLRTRIDRSFHVDPGPLVPAFLVEQFEDLIVPAVFSPDKWGGVPAGGTAFYLEDRLPDVHVSETRFEYASATAWPDGMVIGGPVRPGPEPSRAVLELRRSADEQVGFSVPHFEVWASDHGCKMGWGGYEPPLDDLRYSAGIGLEGLGHYCGFEIVSGGEELAAYVVHDPWAPESQSLGIKVPYQVAQSMHEPVRMIVTTSRGVRLVDFGAIDHAAEPAGAYIDDCLYVDAYTLYWIELPVDPITGQPLPPPPPPWPPPDWDLRTRDVLISKPGNEWATWLEGVDGLRIEVLDVTGLDPGELLHLRTVDHAVDVTANASGRALVPVITARRDRLAPARLIRTSRRSLDGLVTSRTVVFRREASFAAGQRNLLVGAAERHAVVATDFGDRVETFQVEVGNGWSRLDKMEARAISDVTWQVDVPGVQEVVPIPGFPDEAIAVAVLEDGSALLVERDGDGTRVAGSFVGPIGRLDVAGDWGLSTGETNAILYRTTKTRSAPP